MKTDIAELLRTMPDLEPPANGWQRIAARQTRLYWKRRGGFAVAASVVIALIVGYLQVSRPGPTVQPFIVSAPDVRPDARAVDARVRALQQRSQYMERLLNDLPPRGRLARADAAGVIAELEDRIAAVDYQLNRVGINQVGRDQIDSRRADVDGRQFSRPPKRTLKPSPAVGMRYERTESPDLWQRRVEFMGQLVRARYTEASLNGF